MPLLKPQEQGSTAGIAWYDEVQTGRANKRSGGQSQDTTLINKGQVTDDVTKSTEAFEQYIHEAADGRNCNMSG